jgi:hypothetical protein
MQLEINHDLEVTNVKYEDHEGEKVGKGMAACGRDNDTQPGTETSGIVMISL